NLIIHVTGYHTCALPILQKSVNSNISPNHFLEETMLNPFISIIFGSLVFSSAFAAEQFTCKTSAHIVTIDQLSSNQYQYRAWNKNGSETSRERVQCNCRF